MMTWMTFARCIRRIVASATIVTEVLESVISGDEKTLKKIIKENPQHRAALRKLASSAMNASQTMLGRFELERVTDDYRFEAQWPVDDISLRRVYELYRRGELGKRLPAVQQRIA
jgi:hypothetical protein